MTERLYESDSYRTGFDATVTGVKPGDGVCHVTLSKTCFFPEEGGQSCDRGTLGGFQVTDVRICDGEIVHTVSGNLRTGEIVHGEVDFEFRFRNMQMHSAEHIFSGLVNRMFGYDNVGFHLSENSATMDYNGVLSEGDIFLLEERANRVITEGHPIRAWYPAPDELAALSYRSKKEIDGPVRLVEIEDTDLCACCVPHVRNTSEIGFFKILSAEHYKGGMRISYRAGLRALDHFRECLSVLQTAGRLLSVKQEEIPDAIGRLQAETKQLAYQVTESERLRISEAIRAARLQKGADGGPEAASDGNCILFLDTDAGLLRFAMDEARKVFGGVCALFIKTASGQYRYLMESGKPVTEYQNGLRENFGAKGGGKPSSVSGSIAATESEIREFFRAAGID